MIGPLDRVATGGFVPVFECSRCNDLTYSASSEPVQACPRCGELRHRALSGGFADARQMVRDLAPGDHATHVYEDPALIAPFCARYLTEGVNRDERIMAVVPGDFREAISALLAPAVRLLVEWEDPAAVYGDFDADRVAALYETLIGAEPRTVRILATWDGEIARGVEFAEFDRYECLAHDVVSRHGAIAICMYDARSLDPELLRTSAQRHPMAVADSVVRRNEEFEFQPV